MWASSLLWVVKVTFARWRIAQCPRAWAMCVLPVPGGPTISTLAASPTKRQVARSVTWAWLMVGLKPKSKLSSVLVPARHARRTRQATRLVSRRAISSLSSSERKSVYASF